MLPRSSLITRNAHVQILSDQSHVPTPSVHKRGRQIRTPDIQPIRRGCVTHDGRVAIDLVAIDVMFQDELRRVEPAYIKVSPHQLHLYSVHKGPPPRHNQDKPN